MAVTRLMPRRRSKRMFGPKRRHWTRRIPDILWAPVISGALMLVCGGLGLLFHQPWLFPSLGPSALLHAYHPPAAATTLLIALGAFRRTREDAWALIIGVLIMALAGEAARPGRSMAQ